MSETSVQASPQPPAGPVTAEVPRTEAKPRTRKGPVRQALESLASHKFRVVLFGLPITPSFSLADLASLKLTVVLLALSVVLVFCGTLAQIDHGIWVVVKMYFRSFFVWIPFQLFFPRSIHVWRYLGFPFPGGWTLGTLLLLNLVAAHLTRFKLAWRRTGILLIHAGLIVLMMSELLTGLFAVEGNMSIVTGSSSNYVERNDNMELAVITPVDARNEDLTSVPASVLRKGGLIRNEHLPFDVLVVKYMANTRDLVAPAAGDANPATAGVGLKYVALEQAEGVGVDSDAKFDAPSAYVDLRTKDTHESLGVFLVSVLNPETQTVTVDDKKYDVSLRPHRDYKGYAFQLLDFKHDIYPGTNVPKDFRSRVRLSDPGRGENREVEIYMNAPLRYEGETFYQAGFLPGDKGTILQVVRNPAWQMPYIACAMVILGLVIHFGLGLSKFLGFDPFRAFTLLRSARSTAGKAGGK